MDNFPDVIVSLRLDVRNYTFEAFAGVDGRIVLTTKYTEFIEVTRLI